MATEGPGLIVNGGQSSKSPAALLSEQHARDEQHNVTVEDVVDEEDIQHPPPTSQPKPSASESSGAAAPPLAAKSTRAPALDVQSEELFPALGSGPKSKAAANVPTAWGAGRPAATATSQNGASGTSQSSGMSLDSSVSAMQIQELTRYCDKQPPNSRMRRGSWPCPGSIWNNCVWLHLRCSQGIS